MSQTIHKSRALLWVITILSWVVLFGGGLREQYLLSHNLLMDIFGWMDYWRPLSFNIFCLSLYYLSSRYLDNEEQDFSMLLWYYLVVAIITNLVPLGINFFQTLFQLPDNNSHLLEAAFFELEFGALTVHMIVAGVIFKRMILHEKTAFTHYSWAAFQFFLGLSLLSYFTQDLWSRDSEVFRRYMLLAPLLPFALWSLLLSVNMRWIPYLNFRQKVTAIGQLTACMLMLTMAMVSLWRLMESEDILIEQHLAMQVFPLALLTFVLVYGTVAILFLLFNLPTSSVFENKFNELSAFTQLNEAFMKHRSRKDVLKVLFDVCVSTSHCDAAWMEDAQEEHFFQHTLYNREEMAQLVRILQQGGYDFRSPRRISTRPLRKSHPRNRLLGRYRSIMAIPVFTNGKHAAHLFLLKELPGGFDKMLMASVNALVIQASTVLYNLDIMSRIMENERLKNELSIARRMQKRLLPNLEQGLHGLEVSAASKPAREVGGDYYDLFTDTQGRVHFIIADVSGKGTSAAFSMVQLKGIFQGLVRLGVGPEQFLNSANEALSDCLETGGFITATYCQLDPQLRQIVCVRAGHCPTLYYRKQDDQVAYLPNRRSLAFGIIRNKPLASFVETETVSYDAGDILMLYTDGIVEARNEQGEEYGYDRLRDFLYAHRTEPMQAVTDALFEEIRAFTGHSHFEDDFSLLLLRL